MTTNQICNILNNKLIPYNRDVDLKNHTWIKTGGRTEVLINPRNICELKKSYLACLENGIMPDIYGSTSNCFIPNNYNPAVMISTLHLINYSFEEASCTCEPGVRLAKLARAFNENGLSGCEGLAGVPGTVGGAVVNNSGAYGSIISEIFESAVLLRPDGEEIVLSHTDLCFQHRSTAIKKGTLNGMLLSVKLKATGHCNPEILAERTRKIQNHRKATQETKKPSLGTTIAGLEFKRNIRWLLSGLSCRIIQTLVKDPTRKCMMTRNAFVCIYRPNKNIISYMSEYSPFCFLWKDEAAHDVFFEYIDFFKRITRTLQIEVEVKKSH